MTASARKTTTAPIHPIDDVTCAVSANLRSGGVKINGAYTPCRIGPPVRCRITNTRTTTIPMMPNTFTHRGVAASLFDMTFSLMRSSR